MLRLREGESCLAFASSSRRFCPRRPSVGHWTMARVLGLLATHTGALARNLGAERGSPMASALGMARQRARLAPRDDLCSRRRTGKSKAQLFATATFSRARAASLAIPVPIGSPATPTATQQCIPTGGGQLVASIERLRSKLFRHGSAHDSTATRWPRRRVPRPRAPRVPFRRRGPASPPSPHPRA